MVVNRIIDDAAVAAASLTRPPVVAARAQALAHPVSVGGGGVDALRACRRPPGLGRVGRVGERRGRARARLPRHVPRRRLLASGRHHPAGRRRGPARGRPGPHRTRRAARRGHRLRGADRSDARDRPAFASHRPCRPPRPGRRRRTRHAPLAREERHVPGRRPGPAHHHRHSAVAQGRDLVVEGLRPPRSPARPPSRPSTGRCAGRARRRRSGRARTA